MAQDLINYNGLVENALRGVVSTVLQKAAEDGLPGNHHFYIGFRTGAPDVDIPDYLKDRYPDEMTIVVQHQFWGLDITDEWFEITLSFNKRQERLHIPFAAITSFFDPSVQFGLQFQAQAGEQTLSAPGSADELAMGSRPPEDLPISVEAPAEPTEAHGKGDQAADNVVTLDKFRNK
jgi:hypothetical protein